MTNEIKELRDRIAIDAMQCQLNNHEEMKNITEYARDKFPEIVAYRSYAIADAMIAQRDKGLKE